MCSRSETVAAVEWQLSWGKMSFSLGSTTAAEVSVASEAVPQLPCGILQFLSYCQQQDKGQRAQTEAEEVPSEHEEELLPSEGDGTLKQAAEGDCGVSFSRYSRSTWTRSCAACCR